MLEYDAPQRADSIMKLLKIHCCVAMQTLSEHIQVSCFNISLIWLEVWRVI